MIQTVLSVTHLLHKNWDSKLKVKLIPTVEKTVETILYYPNFIVTVS